MRFTYNETTHKDFAIKGTCTGTMSYRGSYYYQSLHNDPFFGYTRDSIQLDNSDLMSRLHPRNKGSLLYLMLRIQ